ncbi:hypothetical protein JW977_00395 [Candidatus Falkowbacteria bacterium]|nr:hypothetical protein [Candidatus Falkowbacteria bacterium]
MELIINTVLYSFLTLSFWIFAVAAVAGVFLFIIGIIFGLAGEGEGLLGSLVGIVCFFVCGYVALVISKPLDYKINIQDRYNNIVHFSRKENKLDKKVKELSNLRMQLFRKQGEVKQLQAVYQNDINGLVREIKSEQQANHIYTYEQAKAHPRINYDLSLIQRKKAYIIKLSETEIKLQHGTYELEYLERQTIDDLRLVKTLKNEEVENLIDNINEIIDKYMPESGKLVINIDQSSLETPEKIWNDLNNR